METGRRRGCDVAKPWRRVDAAAVTWLFRGDKSTPRPRRGYSVETKSTPRPRRGYSVETTRLRYAASQSQNFDAYAAGRCETPGDPLCPCGAWRDVDASGNAVSESYWCSNSSGGGWSEMDQGNGFWHGPVLPTNVTLKNDSDLAGRVRRAWDATKASSEAVVTAWRAQGWFVNMYAGRAETWLCYALQEDGVDPPEIARRLRRLALGISARHPAAGPRPAPDDGTRPSFRRRRK